MLAGTFRYGYLLYGLRIATNHPHPNLAYETIEAELTPDLLIEFFDGKPIPASFVDLEWRLLQVRPAVDATLRIWVATTPAGLVHRIGLLNQQGYLEAIASADGQRRPNHVEVYWQNPSLAPEVNWYNVASWVFDVALSYLARWRIPANLHGSALAMDGKAVALVGSRGAGKSTLAAALIAAGYALLADDHVAIWPRENRYWVEPGTPALRLWPNSLSLLNATAGELPRVYTFVEKRIKVLKAESPELPVEFQRGALPLAAIYLLEPRDPARLQAHLEALPLKQALRALWGQRNTLISVSSEHSADELAVLAQVVQQVPVYRIYRPEGLETLPQVIEAIRSGLKVTGQAETNGQPNLHQ